MGVRQATRMSDGGDGELVVLIPSESVQGLHWDESESGPESEAAVAETAMRPLDLVLSPFLQAGLSWTRITIVVPAGADTKEVRRYLQSRGAAAAVRVVDTEQASTSAGTTSILGIDHNDLPVQLFIVGCSHALVNALPDLPSVGSSGSVSGALYGAADEVLLLSLCPDHRRGLTHLSIETLLGDDWSTPTMLHAALVKVGLSLEDQRADGAHWLPLHAARSHVLATLQSNTDSWPRIVHEQCHARVGLMGNPSDGFGGKTVSFLIRNFAAVVTVEQRSDGGVEIRDPAQFSGPGDVIALSSTQVKNEKRKKLL